MIFSKTEALNILKANSEETVSDQYEQLIFDWKQKYLREIPPVAIIKAHQNKITRLNEAMLTFGFAFKQQAHAGIVLADTATSIDLLKNYQSTLMPIKLGIANATNGVILIQFLNDLVKLEEHLLYNLSVYGKDLAFSDWSLVKLSQSISVFDIQKEILDKGLHESEIMDYLRNEIKNNTFPFQSSLLNLVLKGIKYFQ